MIDVMWLDVVLYDVLWYSDSDSDTDSDSDSDNNGDNDNGDGNQSALDLFVLDSKWNTLSWNMCNTAFQWAH